MKSSIYEYRDYKNYITDLIESSEDRVRGKRKSLAENIGCQVSHVTNVLSGPAHFSSEQGEAAARFFGLNLQETEFLLMLIQFNRAGTTSLSNFYEKMLLQRQKKFSSLKSRLDIPNSLQKKYETEYYGNWIFGAVHVLLSIPGFQSRESIADKLMAPLTRVDQALSLLTEAGLCLKEGSTYKLTQTVLHLDKSSPLISKHHTNWRLKSIMEIDSMNDDQLHYSSVFTLSPDDYIRVKEVLTKALQNSLKIITASPEKEVAVMCLDFFKL